MDTALDKLKIRHLRLLALLAEVGTIRKAAERLRLSQPAVSQMIKDIESAFQGTLFARTRRGVVPNERLLVLMRRARVVLSEMDSAQAELRLKSGPAPVLKLGANLHVLTYLVPEVVRRMRERLPALRFGLHEGPTGRLLDLVASAQLESGRLRAASYASSSARVTRWLAGGASVCMSLPGRTGRFRWRAASRASLSVRHFCVPASNRPSRSSSAGPSTSTWRLPRALLSSPSPCGSRRSTCSAKACCASCHSI